MNKKIKKCSNSQFVFYVFTFIKGCNYNALSRDEIKNCNRFYKYNFVHLYDLNIKKRHVELHRFSKVVREVNEKKKFKLLLMLINNIFHIVSHPCCIFPFYFSISR